MKRRRPLTPAALAKQQATMPTLPELLGQFGIGTFDKESFWNRMNECGFTDADIDQYCVGHSAWINPETQRKEQLREMCFASSRSHKEYLELCRVFGCAS